MRLTLVRHGESDGNVAATLQGCRLEKSGTAAPLVVAHGRFNRILMTLVLGRDLSRMDEIRQRNGSVSVFELGGASGPEAVRLDDVEHLAPNLRVVTGGSDSVR